MQNMQDDNLFLLGTFKKYQDTVQKNQRVPDNQDQYEKLIKEKYIEVTKFGDKLSRMSEQLGGINKYNDDYLKDAQKRQNIKRKYRNLGLNPGQFD